MSTTVELELDLDQEPTRVALIQILKKCTGPVPLKDVEKEMELTVRLGFGQDAIDVIEYAVQDGVVNFNKEDKTLSLPH